MALQNLLPKIEIQAMNLVVLTAQSGVELCSICKLSLDGKCPECDAMQTDSPCVVVKGRCSHAFHEHCVRQWVASHGVCPLCSAPWVLSE